MTRVTEGARAIGARLRADPTGALAVALPALVLVVVGWQRRWTTDDAFINYRIVDHVRAGHGPVFNAGERVEAYTSALWLGILVVGDVLLPLPLEHVAVLCSLALTGLGVAALGAGARKLLAPAAPEGAVWVPAGLLVLLALPPVWDFATGGLETALSLAWTGGVVAALAWEADGEAGRRWWAPVVVGLAPLVRPDAVLVGGAAGLVLVLWAGRDGGVRRGVRVLALGAALPIAYQLFRMAYFGAMVPNTVMAKAGEVPHWEQGRAYLANMVGPYLLWLPLLALGALAAVLGRRLPARGRGVTVVLLGTGLAHAVVVVRAGGDYIHARLLLPSLFALVAPVAVVPVRRATVGALAAGIALWGAVTAAALRPGPAEPRAGTIVAEGRAAIVGALGKEHPVTAEDQGWGPDSPRARRLLGAPLMAGATPVDARPAPGVRVPVTALHGVGVTAYSLGPDVHVVDRLGLADALTARFVLDEPGFIGHEKPIPIAWLAAVLVEGPVDPDAFGGDAYAVPLHRSSPEGFATDVAAARRALRCPALADLDAATTAPLTLGRAWDNLLGAVGRTRLRVDPDPRAAEADLC